MELTYDSKMFQELTTDEMMMIDGGGGLTAGQLAALAYAVVFVGFAPAMAIAAGFGISLGAIGVALSAAGSATTIWGAIDTLKSFGY